MRRRTTRLAMGAALALAPALGLAAATHPASRPALCEGLAASLRARIAGHPHKVPDMDHLRPFAVSSMKPIVTLDLDQPDAARAAMNRVFGPSPLVQQAIFDLYGQPEIARVGRSELFIAKSVGGSASCESFVFVRRGAIASEPPQITGAKEGDMSFCYTESGWYGELGGTPAFVQEAHDIFDPSASYVVAPWLGARWGATCRVDVDFAPAYAVTNAYPGPSAPAGLRALAPVIVQRRDLAYKSEDFHFGASPPPADRAKVARMQRLAAGTDMTALPTFGKAPPSWNSGGDTGYPVTFPLVVGRHTYLAHMVRPTIGWRTARDYLFSVWDLAGGKLTPVAGFYVAKTPGLLRRIKVSP